MDVQETLTIERNGLVYTAMIEEEIMQAVSRPEHDNSEDIANKPAIPSHNKAFVFLSESTS